MTDEPMATERAGQEVARLVTESSETATLLKIIFWVWGIVGLIYNLVAILTLPPNVGVGTSAYYMLSTLVWIAGILMFGIGALLIRRPIAFIRHSGG